MTFDEYQQHDGLGLAELLRKGEVTAAELLDVALARAQQVNPRLNAIVMPMETIARARAKEPLVGPFAGVPFLLKDLFQEYAGVAVSYGNKALKRIAYTPTQHAEITRRWLAAGVVVMGRTNTPEFGAKGITEPEAWGAARNPWNLDHTPGGSSGGSAAAVAAGIVPMAGANDGGGSIRIPAACCGLFGLKPGRGRMPWGPDISEPMHGAAINHIVSRSVRDSAAMLDASWGADAMSPFVIAPPETPYLDAIARAPRRLRIGFSSASPMGTPVHPEAVTAVENAARLLASLGHDVEPAAPGIDGLQMAQDFLMMWFANCAATVDDVQARTGCGNEGFELDTLAMRAFGRAQSAVDYVRAHLRWNDYIRQLAAFHQQYDLWLSPTLAHPPARVGEIATPKWQQQLLKIALKARVSRLALPESLVQNMARENLRWVPYTQLANLTGVPAMSVPLHMTANGLPLGVQFVGRHGSEGLLLQLAAQLEQAQPWMQRRPVL